MPERFDWTTERDRTVLTMRSEGATWDAIAARIGVNRNTVIDRARRLGVAKRSMVQPAPVVSDFHDRPARPAGHPQCWGEITFGTVLQGAPYPYPVFDLR